MPHDRNGMPIEVGDTVTVEAIVTRVEMFEEYCNVTIETTQAMHPSSSHSTLTLNAKQCGVTQKGAAST